MKKIVCIAILTAFAVSAVQANVVWRRDWEQLATKTTVTDTNLDGAGGGGVNIGTQDVTVLSGPARVNDAKKVGGFDLISTTGSGLFEMIVEITSVQYADKTNLSLDFVFGTGASGARNGTWFIEYGTMNNGKFTVLPAVDGGAAIWSHKGGLKDS
jgi:hypothetical protein